MEYNGSDFSDTMGAAQVSPIMLSYIGDAVFTLFIRESLLKSGLKSGQLTKSCAVMVSAVSQSSLMEAILPHLSDGEKEISKRCRNAHTNSRAKNAALSDYKRATALEGLIGFLYLSKNKERLDFILDFCLQSLCANNQGLLSPAVK